MIEFHDVDVSAIMTPRTEIRGIELSEGLPAALKIVGTSLLLIPLSPLFMAPLAHGGVLAELHTLLPKLVLS